jgi:hypothetical protein
MAARRRNEDAYEAAKKAREDYVKARRDYELYRNVGELRKAIRAYYDIVARLEGRHECDKRPPAAIGG